MKRNEMSASYLKALGHPGRLRMARELLKKQMCVGEVEDTLKKGQANASQHLTILRVNGIVESRREGTLKYYYLREPEKIQKIIETVEKATK